MIPAFTQKSRKRLFYSDSNQGFTYFNWEIEEELYRFQKDIESKFKQSKVNKQFKFPFAGPVTPSSAGKRSSSKLKAKEPAKKAATFLGKAEMPVPNKKK